MLSVLRTRHALQKFGWVSEKQWGSDACGLADLDKPWSTAKIQFVEFEGHWCYVYWVDEKFTGRRRTRVENVGVDSRNQF